MGNPLGKCSKNQVNEKIAINRFNYLCTFWQHGRQGVPLKDLREELEEEGLTESIAPERLDELLRRADQDGDKRIRLGEFVRMVSGSSNLYGLIYS